jgi:hypothetical protein
VFCWSTYYYGLRTHVLFHACEQSPAAVEDDQLFIAVKTCEKFHRDRGLYHLICRSEIYCGVFDATILTTVLGLELQYYYFWFSANWLKNSSYTHIGANEMYSQGGKTVQSSCRQSTHKTVEFLYSIKSCDNFFTDAKGLEI